MFDLGWTELLLIGVVALIVVGPKDLPGMFRTVGNLVGKAKRMAREFSQAMNDAADDAGMTDIQRNLHRATSPVSSAMDELKKSTDSFTKQTMESGKPKEAPKLDPERQAMADKIHKKADEKARERLAREAKAAEEAKAAAKPASKSKPAAKSKAKPKTTPAAKSAKDEGN